MGVEATVTVQAVQTKLQSQNLQLPWGLRETVIITKPISGQCVRRKN